LIIGQEKRRENRLEPGQENFGEALIIINETGRRYNMETATAHVYAYEILGKIFFYNNHTIDAFIVYLQYG